MKFKRIALTALIGLNLALLGVMVFQTMNQAKAQDYYFPTTDYVVVTGKFSQNSEALYVIDLYTQKMAVLKVDKTTKKVVLVAKKVRELKEDFRISPASGR